MKRTGWAFGVIVALGLMTLPVRADEAGRLKAREAWIERIKGELALSEEQVKEIRTILESEKPALASEAGAAVDGSAALPDRRQRSKEAIQKIDAVLTPEQRTRWAEIREKRRQAKGASATPEATPAPSPQP
jgi:hypothetical protein